MSISGIGSSSALTIQSLVDMRAQLDDLGRQLGTGKKSADYAGVGLDRGLAVGLRSQMTALNSFSTTISNLGVRLSVAQQSLTRISSIERTVKSVTQLSPFDIDGSGKTSAQQTAQSQLDEILSLLNTKAGDRYLFGGRAVDSPPVQSYSMIIDGDVTHAGFKQVLSERNQADLGTSGLGRVVIPATTPVAAQITGAGATLSADAAAVYTGSIDLTALATAGGTLELNGTSFPIAAGNVASVLSDINGQSGTTGVSASQNGSGRLVLTSVNADTPVTIGPGTSAQILTDLGIAIGTTQPTNLLTQSAATNGQTLIVTVGSNAPLTVTFGTNVGQVSTLAELNTALAGLVGGTAAAGATGNISITATNTTDAIAVSGTADPIKFGLAALSAGPTASVSVSEDVAGSPFGFKLAGISTTIPGAVITSPAGSPPAMSINLLTNPTEGQTVRFSFTLPDGSTEDLTLAATTTSPPGPKQFAIGASPAATAANLQTLLTSETGKLARTSLSAASALAAAHNFFDIDVGQPPQRVSGPPFATATALVAGTSSNTVSWYTGEMGTDPARGTAVARADTSITVQYGVRANEQALRWAVEHVAVFATMSYSGSDPDAQARFAALNQRLGPNLDHPKSVQTIEDIEADLAGTQASLKASQQRHADTKSMLESLLDSIEGVSKEEVGTKILALQTRLQASLQTTAMLYQTSIINYL